MEAKEITNNNLTGFLYRNIASTAIGDKGIAKDKSLRVTQVTIPVILEGSIFYIEKEEKELLEKAIKLVRRLGVNRNRGLGRCQITTR